MVEKTTGVASSTQMDEVARSHSAATQKSVAARSAHPKRRGKRHIWQNILGVVITLIWLWPVYWMVNSAFQPESELRGANPHLFPEHPTLQNFHTAFSNPQFWSAMRSSLIAAGITVVFGATFSLLVALALSRFRFRGRRVFIISILIVQMIPAEALFISQYRMLETWNLLNNIIGLSILYVGAIIPFISWMMRGFVDGIPIELEEAAMVDGASRIGAFFRVTLPLLVPGLIATSVFAFLFAWNEYTLALIVLNRNTVMTLPLWLQTFQQGMRATDWGGVMAGSTLISLPVIIIFVLIQNKISQGMVAGAVKG